MSIRKFNVNKTESQIALASAAYPGFMSPEDKIALDALVAANFAGGSITSVTVTMTDVTEIKEKIAILETTVDALKNKLDEYPVLTSAMKTDGQGYLLVNNKFEPVFPANVSPLYEDIITTATINALESGNIPKGLTEEQLNLVKENIGEEIWSELNRVVTLNLTPQISESKKMIENAKKSYVERKKNKENVIFELENYES